MLNILSPILKLIGSLIPAYPAVPINKLHYKYLEKNKMQCVQIKQRNFNAKNSKIDYLSHGTLKQWKQETPNADRDIYLPQVDFETCNDASEINWDASYGRTSTGGAWNKDRKNLITFSELKTV